MGLFQRIRNLTSRKSLDADIEAELRAHLEMAAEDEIRAGRSASEARRIARLRFGNPVALRERTTAADTALALDNFGRDLRHALRHLRQAPAFTLAAVLTLALGIGATTAVFTLVQQVMLRTLPVAQPQQLWRIGDSTGCCFSSGYTQNGNHGQNDWSLFSWQAYRLFRDHTPAFQHLTAFQIGEANAELAVRRAGSPQPVQSRNGEYVSGNFFRTFGVSAWRGRLFARSDDRLGAPPVAVISFHAWQADYASSPSVVGATYNINGHPFTVIGVAPPGFYGAKLAVSGMPDFWLPLATEPLIAGKTSRLRNPALAWLDLIGRVRPGVSPHSLQSQLQTELHNWLAAHLPDMTPPEKSLWRQQTLHLTPGGAGVSLMRRNYRGGLRLLLLAALCVLLLACANIANLLLARGLRNRRQTAVHVALGSPRSRLVRSALVESILLAILGGLAGIAVAWAGARLILRLAYAHSAQSTWIPIHAAPSAPVLLFALAISLVTGVLFGVVPAWTTSRAQPIEAMRGTGRSIGAQRHWLQNALVIAQAALSLVLLSTAALLGQSLRNLEHRNLGFHPRGRYLVSIDPHASGIPRQQLVPLFQEIRQRLRVLPGVRVVAAVFEAPPGGWVSHSIRVEGQPAPPSTANSRSGWTRVTPGFFRTLGVPILAGRPITAADDASTRPVTVVSQAFARRFFGRRNPIGQHFGPASANNPALYTIVGVAANVAVENRLTQPTYYLPEAQTTRFGTPEAQRQELWSHDLYNIVLWAPGNPPRVPGQIKKALAAADPGLILYSTQPYSAVIRANFARQNMIASLAGLFGAIGLILAAIGLYGITAYSVEQRTAEIGVRMALGASRPRVIRLVLRGAFTHVAIGLALGIPSAIAAGALIASRLYGVAPWNPLLLAAATLLLALAAFLAAILPAQRAAAVNPTHALRSE